MITAQSISTSIKNYCIKSGITQKEFAKIIGVSQPTVNRWVTGDRRPSLASIEKLQEIIGKLEEE